MSLKEKIFCIYCRQELHSQSEIIKQAHDECYSEIMAEKLSKITSLEIYGESTFKKKIIESDNRLYLTDKSLDTNIISLLINLDFIKFENIEIEIPNINIFEKISKVEIIFTPTTVIPDDTNYDLHNLNLGQFHNTNELEIHGYFEKKITTLSPDFGRLVNLKCLKLINTDIQILPNIFQNMTKLEVLLIDGARITEIPSSLLELPLLSRLYIYNSDLFMIPSLANLNKLIFIWISMVKDSKKLLIPFSYLPEKIPKNLTEFRIYNYEVNYKIGHERELIVPYNTLIKVYRNLLTTLVIDINFRKKITRNNNILVTYADSFPYWLGDLKNLKRIVIVDISNDITIPESILELNSLIEFYCLNIQDLKMSRRIKDFLHTKYSKWLSAEEFFDRFKIVIKEREVLQRN